MKKLIVLSGVVLLASCATFHETKGIVITRPIIKVAVENFESSDPTVGKLFADVIQAELSAKGFEIVEPGQAEIIISGVTTQATKGGWIVGVKDWTDSVFAIAKTNKGKIVQTVRFDQGSAAVGMWGNKSTADIASDIGKRFANKLHAR